MTSTATELRLGLLAVGIPPLPSTTTKEVFLTGWPTRPIDEREVRSWDGRPDWPNTSGRTTNHPCLDIDILDDAVASAVEQLVRTRFDARGVLLLRTGRAPKRLIPFCADVPFAKRTLCYTAPSGMRHRIEFLGDGQQAVFFGMHESGKPYHWHAGRDPLKVPPREWVKIAEAEADEVLNDIDELLVEQFGYTRVALPGPDGTPQPHARVTDADAALRGLHYAGRGAGGNVHDTVLGCINALIVQGTAAESAVEEVLAAVRVYAATNPLCAKWDWVRGRRLLEGMAYSFINKFPDYADRLPPDLYAARQACRGQGVLDPQLVYDRVRKLWHYPELAQEAPRSGSSGAAGGPAGGNGKAAPEPKFRLIPFGQLRPGNDPGYLVDELIPLRGIVLIWGKRKCLKSFWTYDLSFHVAHCPEYRGRSILAGGAVVYCAFEGAHGYKKRAEALRRHHQIPDDVDVPLYLVPGRANMIKEYPLLISAVREQLLGEIPRAIVLDTLNKSLVGSESKDVDMAAYIVAAEALRDAFDCVVIIIHHCGYDETHPRGHTSLTGAVDAEFEVVREGMLVTVKNVTMRDGPEGFEIRSQAEVVEVGADITGKVLTSLVITQTDAPAAAGRRGKGRPDAAMPVLTNALRAALAERGSPFRPPGGKATEHAVSEQEVRTRFDFAYPSGEDTAEKAAEATATAYRRALQRAVEKDVICKGVRGLDVVLWFQTATG
jgi:AAA domain